MSTEKIGIPENKLGYRLKTLRLSIRLTQKEFAEKLSVSGGYISDIEKGKANPSGAVISEITNAYRINREWLESGIGSMNAEPNPPTTEEKNRIWGETRKEELRNRPRPTQEERHLRHIVEWMDDEFTKYPDNGLSFYVYLRDNYDSFKLFIEKKQTGQDFPNQKPGEADAVNGE